MTTIPNDLVAEICTMIRFQTSSPSAGADALALALYMHWRNWQDPAEGDFEAFLMNFTVKMKNLHLANDIKTGMQ